MQDKYKKEMITMVDELLLKGRIINLIGEIDDKLSTMVINQLQYLNSLNHNPITLQINSPGGSIIDGLSIIDVMEAIDSPVYTLVLGRASSMASLILAAGESGFRKANKHAEIVLHQPIAGMQGQITDISITYHSLVNYKKELMKMYSEYTHQSIKKIQKDLERDFYLNATAALEYGIIDKII